VSERRGRGDGRDGELQVGLGRQRETAQQHGAGRQVATCALAFFSRE
jgi:hypothetical protein